jgi:drug/metabolite transporter (DMT)-like permease
MQKFLAFTTVLVVWSTTPLAIKFASMGSAPFFAASSRMFIGVALCFIILFFKNHKLEFNKFWQNYFLAGLGIFITLGCVYIAATKISSGMIAIIFALTPIITGVVANIILKNKEFDTQKLIATILGFCGMLIIFFEYGSFKVDILYLFLLIFAMSFQAVISVKLKKLKSSATSLQTTTGALLISLPFFIISFFIFETSVPEVSNIAIISTIYLGIFGSVFAFISYYYLIKSVSVLTVGIIPLITPIFALILGYYFNNESINNTQIFGFIVVLISIIYYQTYPKIYEKFTKLR